MRRRWSTARRAGPSSSSGTRHGRSPRALMGSGVGPGDRVALWSPNSSRWIATSFAVYLAGAVLVPVNTRFKGAEAAHVLRRSGASVLLGSSDTLGTDLIGLLDDVGDLPALRERVVTDGPNRSDSTPWDEFVRRGDAGADGPWPAVRPGRSRRHHLYLRHHRIPEGRHAGPRSERAHLYRVGRRGGSPPRGPLPVRLSVLPHRRLEVGRAGLRPARGDCPPARGLRPGAVMRRVAEEQISVLPGPPTVFQSILEHPERDTFDLSTLRLSVTGAATVPVEVIRRMRDDLHIATVVTGYGLTETTGTVSMCRHDDPPEIIATTVGKPLDGVSVKIVDDAGQVLGATEPGEILVRGFNVMRGYFDDEEASAAAIDEEGWLRTGDIGFVGTDGNLRITDRKKDMFIVGGFNAFPAEIEGILLTHPGVGQVAVVGVPDERLGEVGRAYVIPRAGVEVDEASIIAWCREHMANYKVPRTVVLVDELPLTASGKVQRFRLRSTVQA